ncbi:MAG: hypothetical protein KDA61_04985 [Planctomycetales bacterium]|nr:hypothetical protein [Planctomycetales bacterium]
MRIQCRQLVPWIVWGGTVAASNVLVRLLAREFGFDTDTEWSGTLPIAIGTVAAFVVVGYVVMSKSDAQANQHDPTAE